MKFLLYFIELQQRVSLSISEVFALYSTLLGQGRETLSKAWAILNTEKYSHISQPFERSALLAIQAITEFKHGCNLFKEAVKNNPEDFKFIPEFGQEMDKYNTLMGAAMGEIDKFQKRFKNEKALPTVPEFIRYSTEYRTFLAQGKVIVDEATFLKVLTEKSALWGDSFKDMFDNAAANLAMKGHTTVKASHEEWILFGDIFETEQVEISKLLNPDLPGSKEWFEFVQKMEDALKEIKTHV